jgi:hypothetical protein
MTTSDPRYVPEQGEDEDYLDYLSRKADLYQDNPPPAPPGMKLIECDHEPRHWPVYTIADEDFYDGPCSDCVGDDYRKQLADLKRKSHWRDHPLRGRVPNWIVSKLCTLGVIASYGTTFGGDTGCNWCINGITFRGRRTYILGWPTWKWGCVLKRRHRPGEHVGFGMCGKCLPCPDCGTTKADHDCEQEKTT